MRSQSIRVAAVQVLQSPLVPLATAVLLLTVRAVTTPEVWGDLAIGRTLVQVGLPRTDATVLAGPDREWMDLRWLYHAVLYLAWGLGGPWAWVVLKGLATAAAIGLTVAANRNARGASWSAALAALVLLGVVAPRWELSAVLCCAPLAAGIILLADFQPKVSWLYGLGLPLQVLWVNLDPSGWLGPLFAAASWFVLRAPQGRRLDHGRARFVWPLALATAAAIVHPYAPRHLAWALSHWRQYGTPVALATWPQWIPQPVSMLRVLAGYVPPVLVTGSLILTDLRRQAPVVGRALLGMILLLYAPGLAAIGWVALVPCVAELAGWALQRVGTGLRHRWVHVAEPERAWRILHATVGWPIAAVSLVGLGALVREADPFLVWGRAVVTDHLPWAVASVLRASGLPCDRLFCLPADGSVLAWELPGARVYCDLQPARSVSTNIPSWTEFVQSPPDKFLQRLQEAKLDAVLVPTLVPAALAWFERARNLRGYELAYFDGLHAVLVRSRSTWAAPHYVQSLRKAGLTALHQEAGSFTRAVREGRRTRPPPRVLGAALYYLAAGHSTQAAEALELIRVAGGQPPELDLLLARAYLRMQDPTRAVEAAQRFVRQRPRSTSGWQTLAQAWTLAGRTNEARRILERFRASSSSDAP